MSRFDGNSSKSNIEWVEAKKRKIDNSVMKWPPGTPVDGFLLRRIPVVTNHGRGTGEMNKL